MKLKILDLFSGIGGFSLGLERTEGFKTVAFCEIDEHCHKVLKKHWPNVPIYEDVSILNGNSFKNIDVICGGFPCQDISVAGKQKGIKDGTRSGLWFEYKRLIGEIRPRYVIIENVAALRSNGLVTVLQDLWSLGYDAEWHIISARSIGACHLRERIWIIAYPNCERLERSNVSSSSSSTDREETLTNNRLISKCRKTNSPHTYNLRLWKSFTSEKAKQEWWTETSASQRDWWKIESAICRMDDAISDGLHESERFRKQRIKQLGNSIVPGIVEIIGNGIIAYESNKNNLARSVKK